MAMPTCLAVFLFVGLASAGATEDESVGTEEADCQPPFWHGKLGDNWPLAGILAKSRPSFRLSVRNTINGTYYKARKPHGVTLLALRPKKKSPKRIHGFILSQTTDTETCGLGVFKIRNVKKAANATVRADCGDVILDGGTDVIKVRAIKWKAPKCGCVTLRVEIKSADNIIYSDDPDSEESDEYRILTKTLCPPAVDLPTPA